MMKARARWTVAALLALGGVSLAQSAGTKELTPGSDRERLIGAWHLVSITAPGADAGSNPAAEIKGTLIYTRDGHMSVQLMYPESAATLSNDYVLNGYEASFGSYDVNEKTHTVTHHVQGSITRDLSGKTSPASTSFPATASSSGQLIPTNTGRSRGNITDRLAATLAAAQGDIAKRSNNASCCRKAVGWKVRTAENSTR